MWEGGVLNDSCFFSHLCLTSNGCQSWHLLDYRQRTTIWPTWLEASLVLSDCLHWQWRYLPAAQEFLSCGLSESWIKALLRPSILLRLIQQQKNVTIVCMSVVNKRSSKTDIKTLIINMFYVIYWGDLIFLSSQRWDKEVTSSVLQWLQSIRLLLSLQSTKKTHTETQTHTEPLVPTLRASPASQFSK